MSPRRRVLLSHADFASTSVALCSIKSFAKTDPIIAEAWSIGILKSSVTEHPEAWVTRLVQTAREARPEVVGLSIYVWSRFRMYEATRRLRRELPDALIIWGGPDVSDEDYARELLAENPDVDVIVRDEGEQTFQRLLLMRLGRSPGLSEIRGLTWRDRTTGEIHQTGEVDYLANLDAIPSANEWEDIDLDSLESIGLETFRGCYMGCNYCYWGGTTRRAFSDERVFSDLGRILERPNVRNIWFYDSMFGYKKQLAKDILRFIIAKKRPDVSITFYPNLDFLDEDLCRLMKAANVYIECGIQTTNQVAYENMNRKWDRPFLDKKIPILKKYGLKSNSDQLILGLPGDDIEGFRGSVAYAFATRPDTIFISPFSVLPGTGFWPRRQEFGLRYDGELRIVYANSTFSEADMIAGGFIMIGAKWYGKFPGLAEHIVALLGIPPADFFEKLGITFAADVWNLRPDPADFPTLRKKLLLQALPEHDEQYLVLELLRRTLARFYPGRLDSIIDDMLTHAELLNCDELVDLRGESDARAAEVIEAWREHPRATPVLEASSDVLIPGSLGADAPASPIAFVAHPLPAPHDFFGKDRPRYRVVILSDALARDLRSAPKRALA